MTALEPRDDERERDHPDVSQSTGDQVVGSLIERLSDPCTSVELAAALGKSPKTIVDWCQERAYTNIPCFRLGNRWYHRVPELMKWLNGIKSGHLEFRRRPRNSAERK
jgi:hypothetical protein